MSAQHRVDRNVGDARRLALDRWKLEQLRDHRVTVERRELFHRTVKERKRKHAGRRAHGFGKEDAVFIVAARKTVRFEIHQAQTVPVVAVGRKSERDARTRGSEPRVHHHVAFERRHVCHARILAAHAAALGRTRFVRRTAVRARSPNFRNERCRRLRCRGTNRHATRCRPRRRAGRAAVRRPVRARTPGSGRLRLRPDYRRIPGPCPDETRWHRIAPSRSSLPHNYR